MPEESKPSTMSVDEVREILNRWSSSRLLTVSMLGDKIDIDSVVNQVCHVVRIVSQYELRGTYQRAVPYRGGPLDNAGTPPDPLKIRVQRPSDFSSYIVEVAIPHTEWVAACSNCTGGGSVQCRSCGGMGKNTCTGCRGKGWNERTAVVTGQNRVETSIEHCIHCVDGKVSCGGCL